MHAKISCLSSLQDRSRVATVSTVSMTQIWCLAGGATCYVAKLTSQSCYHINLMSEAEQKALTQQLYLIARACALLPKHHLLVCS